MMKALFNSIDEVVALRNEFKERYVCDCAASDNPASFPAILVWHEEDYDTWEYSREYNFIAYGDWVYIEDFKQENK
jgi:hypothetical protein